jgi:hypothetical protein
VLFGEVLVLCREAGLVSVGVVAVDGTKVHANASNMVNRDYRQLAEEVLAQADRIDREEDALYGDARGDELHEHPRTAEGRRKAFKEAKERLARRRVEKAASEDESAGVGVALEFDQEVIVARVQGHPTTSTESPPQADRQHSRGNVSAGTHSPPPRIYPTATSSCGSLSVTASGSQGSYRPARVASRYSPVRRGRCL